MTQFLKKNAKLIYIIFGVMCALLIVIACVFMTPYNGTAVAYNKDYLQGIEAGLMSTNPGLVAFTIAAGYNFSDVFYYMFVFNRGLQTVNDMILYSGLVSLIMFAAMMICANASRKKYYISNLVSGIACPIVCIIMSIITIVLAFSAITPLFDPEMYELLNWCAIGNTNEAFTAAIETWRNQDTSGFTVTITPVILLSVYFVIFIIANVGLILYTVFRFKETKKELAQGYDLEKVVGADV